MAAGSWSRSGSRRWRKSDHRLSTNGPAPSDAGAGSCSCQQNRDEVTNNVVVVLLLLQDGRRIVAYGSPAVPACYCGSPNAYSLLLNVPNPKLL